MANLAVVTSRAALAAALALASIHSYAQFTEQTAQRLSELVSSNDRPERHKLRDKYRRPVETLRFCGVDPVSTVVEIWPGGQGGWYRRIVQPLVKESGGTYIPVTADKKYLGEEKSVPYGEVDMVLVFRAHGFLIYDKPAQNYVDSIFNMLRPGGVFCIVDHAGNETVPQDPDAKNGYVNESYFKAMAIRAGFTLDAVSDHNRNPLDTKDYPRGLYSLPPTLAGSRSGSDERDRFLRIGESDRFTHRYVKPGVGE